MTGEIIKIDITETDARLFVAFQANYKTFETLVKAGVFDITNGKAILNFNSEGKLADVEIQTHTFRLGKQGVYYLQLYIVTPA